MLALPHPIAARKGQLLLPPYISTSYLDADDSLPQPSSQALPLAVSSDSFRSSDTSDEQSDGDSEPRRSGRVKKASGTVKSR
jgi:hypothetical protein